MPLGPVIGPLVICGYLIDEEKEPLLKKLSVRDSKLLSTRRREYLAVKLKEIADDLVILKLSPVEIDKLRTKTNLNKIEIHRIQEIINLLEPDKVIIDSVEADTKKFCDKISKGLKTKPNFICENFADKKYPVVSAASIIAKVTRDHDIKSLHKKYGDFGSGYTSDERTINFLKSWIKRNKQFPWFVRRSWVTTKTIKNDAKQKRVGEFFENG